MKKCPFCAEEIQDAAVKCRYCGSPLDPTTTLVAPSQPANDAPASDGWYPGKSTSEAGLCPSCHSERLITVKSRRFARSTAWVWTAVYLGVFVLILTAPLSEAERRFATACNRWFAVGMGISWFWWKTQQKCPKCEAERFTRRTDFAVVTGVLLLVWGSGLVWGMRTPPAPDSLAVLSQVAAEANKTLPRQSDQITELTHMSAEAGRLISHYTIQRASTDMDLSVFGPAFDAGIRADVCVNSVISESTKLGITHIFRYTSQDGVLLRTVVISKQTCEGR